ncbi:MAG: tRNA pseudouridine(38-40) synthase TruA [Psychroflexus sp.]|nr:tRNA pseudouridine(38-40) synthase TruA [Psychroflexus sp.]
MRYFIEMAFHGAAYAGWQKQPNDITVQSVLEKALYTVFQSEVPCVGAGRTDAGVHATFFIAHFDVEEKFDDQQFIFKMNQLLPHDVCVKDVYPVRAEAHARFDAISRTYKYYITQQKDPFRLDRATYIKKPLSVELMNEAAEILLDYINFKSFSKVKTQVYTYHCKVIEAFWEQNNNLLIFKIKADRFLRNMVRAIVGTLVEVGLKTKTIDDFKKVIESENRGKAGKSMPAHGLFLTDIGYPEQIKL